MLGDARAAIESAQRAPGFRLATRAGGVGYWMTRLCQLRSTHVGGWAMRSRRLALLAAGVAGVVGLAVAVWLFDTRTPNGTGKRDDGLSAAPAKPAADPFGFSAAFDAEIKKIGQITPRQFADHYPAPKYL